MANGKIEKQIEKIFHPSPPTPLHTYSHTSSIDYGSFFWLLFRFDPKRKQKDYFQIKKKEKKINLLVHQMINFTSNHNGKFGDENY